MKAEDTLTGNHDTASANVSPLMRAKLQCQVSRYAETLDNLHRISLHPNRIIIHCYLAVAEAVDDHCSASAA